MCQESRAGMSRAGLSRTGMSRAGAAVAMLLGLAAMTAPAAAQQGGVAEQFDDIRNSLGFGRARPPIDFTERPPLVVPPSDTLPAPSARSPSIGVNDPDIESRRKALTDSRRPVPPSDPGAGVSGPAGRAYLVEPPAGLRDPSTLGPDTTTYRAKGAIGKPERKRHAKRRTPAVEAAQ